jgi:hypothetical protein
MIETSNKAYLPCTRRQELSNVSKSLRETVYQPLGGSVGFLGGDVDSHSAEREE